MNVRRLGPGDEGVVRALAEREPQVGLLADEGTMFLAAFEDSTPIGFVLAYVLPRRHGEPEHLFVYEIGVREDDRRRGVGRALMRRLAELAGERGVRDAFLLTNESNAAAPLCQPHEIAANPPRRQKIGRDDPHGARLGEVPAQTFLERIAADLR